MKLDTAAKAPFISNHQTISRRKFLRGAGIVVAQEIESFAVHGVHPEERQKTLAVSAV